MSERRRVEVELSSPATKSSGAIHCDKPLSEGRAPVQSVRSATERARWRSSSSVSVIGLPRCCWRCRVFATMSSAMSGRTPRSARPGIAEQRDGLAGSSRRRPRPSRPVGRSAAPPRPGSDPARGSRVTVPQRATLTSTTGRQQRGADRPVRGHRPCRRSPRRNRAPHRVSRSPGTSRRAGCRAPCRCARPRRNRPRRRPAGR